MIGRLIDSTAKFRDYIIVVKLEGFTSRESYVQWTSKKCTKKRDARVEL